MASGLIYLIILGMWGAYFIPRWMSQHDTTSGRATARYKSAMKVVASTPNIPEMIDPDQKLRALRQRQLIAVVIAATTLVTFGAAIAGAFSIALTLVPLTALAIFLVHSRRQVVAAELKKRRLKAIATITTAEIKLDPTVRISLSPRPATELQEHWIPLADRVNSSTITIIEREDAYTPVLPESTAATWSPIAVPKPTYAVAPKAFKPQRLTVPGVWSAEQERLEVLGEPQLSAPARDALFDQELTEQAAVVRRSHAANQ
jgi:hypothetical protein